MQQAAPKGLIDARAVGQLLSVKVSTIYKWAHEGRIPFYRLGRLIRFDEHEILAWAARQRAKPPRPWAERF